MDYVKYKRFFGGSGLVMFFVVWYISTMQNIIVNKISKRYGHSVIFREVHASIGAGVYGISGPNGSGKSTLMKCLSGLIRPDRGSLEWKVQDSVLETKDLYGFMGFSAPYVRLYNDLSCTENLRLIAELSGSGGDDETLGRLFDEIGLPDKADAWYGRLSSGQQQRMRLAAALIKDPAFLLLDEPGTNLDTAGFDLIGRIVTKGRAEGKTVVVASNESRELDLCDQIIDINAFKST